MYFVFREFLEGVEFLENWSNFFEDSSLKAFLRQSFRVFDLSNLSSDSRYLESVNINALSEKYDPPASLSGNSVFLSDSVQKPHFERYNED